MNIQDVFSRYIEINNNNLRENTKIISILKKNCIFEDLITNNFNIGFSSGNIIEIIGDNEDIRQKLSESGIIKNDKDIFTNFLTIPIYDENKAIINIIGYNIFPQSKNKMIFLNEKGIFNQNFLKNNREIIITENPIDTLILIQNNYPNSTFIYGDDKKFLNFVTENKIIKTIFTFEGKANLFYELTKNGISTKRVLIEFDKTKEDKAYLSEIFKSNDNENSKDIIKEIENGFIFNFPHLNYRVIGNFSEYSLNLKVNIKAYTQNDVFVDNIDLYKNRDRQNYTFNVMEKFGFRDQLQIETDLNQIIEVIEKHKDKKENDKKKTKPELTEYQQDIGINFLKNPNIIDEIEKDITDLGYVREKKNKILLYLVMTSRLLESPLHSIIISRSGAGKSQLADIIENLCPPEELQSISDLSAQALYYYGIDDLKNKFIVIGEKEGSEGADYPLRELISKKSISKAIPLKDNITGQIRTVNIKVNGPIALVETTTNGEVNAENLNRCFVIGIDETEEQTKLIHQNQRKKYTLEGYLAKKTQNKIIEKHIYAQRLLKKVNIFNPYAQLLTFPSSKLKTRRDNEKLLRLINVICFLHQYQRKVKKHKLNDNDVIEYIECSIDDYKIAYELLSDGILDNTLDDLPRPARELLEIIKRYLKEKSEKDNIPVEKIIFERKDIRDYSSWSFAQIRNNFRILKDYEHIQLVKGKNGLAHQYKLSNYNDIEFLNTILTPEELEKRIKEKQPA